MKYVTVTITDDDIAHGKRMNGQSCPIARAIRTVYPKAHIAQTFWYPLGFDDGATAPLTKRAVAFIDRFDNGLPVEPTTFRLAVA